MYDYLHKHKRIAQFILALIMVPFAFVGVDYYFRRTDSQQTVATVGDSKISRAEYDELVREQQERMRQEMGRGFDPAIFDNPEVRYALVDQLVSQRVLYERARAERFRVTDAELQRMIAQLPPFQVDGKFSPERYRQLLGAQNMTPLMFEQRMRQDLLLAPLQEPVAGANIVARSSGERYLALLEQQREVAAATIDAEPFLKEVKIDDAAVKSFYDANTAAFQTPEQARIEYVILGQDAFVAQVAVDPAEVRKRYDETQKNYAAAEERAAAHILIGVKPDAKPEQKEAARKKAEAIAAQVRASPAKFAEAAKQNSEDPGSAQQGGDLGSFTRGSMVKPFEDAVFAARSGDVVGPIETDFGYHVIKVGAVSAARTRAFDEVKADIEAELRRQKAGQRFATAAEQFQNLVYEQGDSLDAVSKTLGIKVQTTPLLTRAQVQQLALGNAKFVQALFSPESIQAKRNTEAIEVAPNTLMAGRIVEYKPAAARPFDDVKDEIRAQLARKAASELAQKAGTEKLALLTEGKSAKEAGLAFGKPVTLSRTQVQPGFPPDALVRIFQADGAKLPAYVGATNEKGGYSIYRLTQVITPGSGDSQRLATANARVGEQLGRELLNAYVATLKAKADVKIEQKALEQK
jgi:peptidyl-prolyl cis-trans isomerase D